MSLSPCMRKTYNNFTSVRFSHDQATPAVRFYRPLCDRARIDYIIQMPPQTVRLLGLKLAALLPDSLFSCQSMRESIRVLPELFAAIIFRGSSRVLP